MAILCKVSRDGAHVFNPEGVCSHCGKYERDADTYKNDVELQDAIDAVKRTRAAVGCVGSPEGGHIITEDGICDCCGVRVLGIASDVDLGNAPPHYNQAGIECIDAIAAATSGKSGIEAVCIANVVKYLWRYELKNGVEDVKKARWYLDRLIGELEK